MKLLSKIKSFLFDRRKRFLYLGSKGMYNFLDDESYIKRDFLYQFGVELDLQDPKTFNEKIQWLKLNDRKEIYTKLVDKYMVRTYIKELWGEEYLIPLLGVWDSPDEIDFNKLPDKFVLKCNHNSGLGMTICKNKEGLEVKKVRKQLKKALRQNYYKMGREWPYKNVQRKIVAEKYMEDQNGCLNDYKVFVFNGKAHFIQVDYDRFTDHHRNFYDLNWEYVPFTTCYPTNADHVVEKPVCLDEMIEKAEQVTNDIGTPPFLRVDFYVIDGRLYFGELTFYHGSGTEKFMPAEYDRILGDLMSLKMK